MLCLVWVPHLVEKPTEFDIYIKNTLVYCIIFVVIFVMQKQDFESCLISALNKKLPLPDMEKRFCRPMLDSVGVTS